MKAACLSTKHWRVFRNVSNFPSSRRAISLSDGRQYHNQHNQKENINEENGMRKKWQYTGLLGGILVTYYCRKYLTKDSSLPFSPLKANCATWNGSLPTYTMEEVSKHKNPKESVWVTYEGKVYDITSFISQHPGGSKILLAAGGPLEPYWAIYAVHKNAEVKKILNEYLIGQLSQSDIDAQNKLNTAALSANDPFANDPIRHAALKVVSAKPFNAETPAELINDHPFTPQDLFFVRNHLPVPKIIDQNFRLEVHAPPTVLLRPLHLTVKELQMKFPVRKIDAVVMCSGNRRTDMGTYKPVRGLAWTTGAISNATWTGVPLRHLLAWCLGMDEEKLTVGWCSKHGIRHVQFEGLDKDESGMPYGASVPVELALDPSVEALVVYEMNGEPLSVDHGYPLRVIVPGLVGARQVKWLHKIILSDKESSSFWQQKDYKTFSPSADVANLDYDRSPAIMEPPVQSAICWPPGNAAIDVDDGTFLVKGYAWSGGGRGIIRVEVSIDDGETWFSANLYSVNHSSPTDQPIDPTTLRQRGQWAWTLWDVEVPVQFLNNEKSREVKILCKAVDSAQNCQPESFRGTWNARGLLANAWHSVNVTLERGDE